MKKLKTHLDLEIRTFDSHYQHSSYSEVRVESHKFEYIKFTFHPPSEQYLRRNHTGTTRIGNATISQPRDFAQSEYVWPSSSGSVYITIFIKTVIWKKDHWPHKILLMFSWQLFKEASVTVLNFFLIINANGKHHFVYKLTPITRRETNFQHISQYFVGLFPSIANMLSENLLYPRRET